MHVPQRALERMHATPRPICSCMAGALPDQKHVAMRLAAAPTWVAKLCIIKVVVWMQFVVLPVVVLHAIHIYSPNVCEV